MKKQLFRTLVAIGVLSAMMAFGACTEKENVTTDDSINNNIEDAISVETPRSIIMGSDGNLYITAYYPRSVARYDLTKKAITAICELGDYQPEGLAEVNGKIYVASGYITDENSNILYDNKLYVVDINSFEVVESITVGRNPSKVKKLDDNHIVFNTLGDYGNDMGGLWIMDVTTKDITKLDIMLYNFDVYDGTIYGYTNIYGSEPLGFYRIDGTSLESTAMGIDWNASDNPYGIAVNPYNGDIIITTDGNYTAKGDCYVYNSDSYLRTGSIQAGNFPSKIVALNNDELLVLNEGAWGANNASVSKVNVAAGTAVNDFFDRANGRGLGDVAQDILLDGNKAYITVSFSNSIETMDATTGSSTRYATAK